MQWQPQKKNLKKLSQASCTGMALLLLLLTASGCANVAIRNSRWYADVGSQGALWAETQTVNEGEVPQPVWDDMRFGMLCTSADTFADWKSVIEKLCSVSGKCTYEIRKQINQTFGSLNQLKRDAERRRR